MLFEVLQRIISQNQPATFDVKFSYCLMVKISQIGQTTDDGLTEAVDIVTAYYSHVQ